MSAVLEIYISLCNRKVHLFYCKKEHFYVKLRYVILQARRQGGVRRVRLHPPRAEKVRLEVTCSAENVNL